MSSFRWLLAVIVHFAFCLTATAAGHVAVGNGTDRTVEFQLVHGPAKPVTVVLEPGESRAFPVGRG
jgi:hypothetical protein